MSKNINANNFDVDRLLLVGQKKCIFFSLYKHSSNRSSYTQLYYVLF